jgi:hypothetical protein
LESGKLIKNFKIDNVVVNIKEQKIEINSNMDELVTCGFLIISLRDITPWNENTFIEINGNVLKLDSSENTLPFIKNLIKFGLNSKKVKITINYDTTILMEDYIYVSNKHITETEAWENSRKNVNI